MTSLCAQGVRLWEPPPNSQGLAALLLLNILESFPLKGIRLIKTHFQIRGAQRKIKLCVCCKILNTKSLEMKICGH